MTGANDPGRTADYPPPFRPPAPPPPDLAAARLSIEEEWGRGNRVPAEWYLARVPGADANVVLDLVYLEYVLREEAGDPGTADEYAARFPAIAAPLRRLLALDHALSGTANRTADPFATTASPHPADRPVGPPAIGRYLVVEALGSGGQGEVFVALHSGLGREVVVKRLRGHASAAEADRLAAEGRVLAALDHPNLARVYDVDVADGRPFIVMESVRGRNLADVRRTGPVAPADAARWVAAVARAADHAHTRGILHLDIKPRNVVLGETGRPVLIDFGLARVERAHAPAPVDMSVSGTLAYMAPEQARGENDRLGPAADVYGLGGVLFHLLTGRDPIPGRSAADILGRARAGDWDREALKACRAPAALVRACERAMAPDLAVRFPSAAAFADALDAAVRPRGRVIAAAVGLVAVALAVAVLVWPRDRGGSDPQPAEPAVAPAPAPRPDLRFTMRVYRPALRKAFDNPPGPFAVGEGVRFSGIVPAGRHAAFVLVTEAGGPKVLAAAPPADDERTLAWPESRAGAVDYSNLTAPGGTHVVLLAVSASGPVTPDRLGLAAGEPWPRLAAESLLKLAGGRAEIVEKGRDFGTASAVDDPEEAVRERLTRLSQTLPAGTAAEGVAFAVRERP